MAQHDYVISNGTGAAVRSDLNNALAAIVSQNSGATAPSPTYAYQFWADTTTGLLKLRNSANSAWITLFQLDGEWSTLPVENGTAAAPSIYFKDSGTDTGFYSPGTDQIGISTGGTARLTIDANGNVAVDTNTLYVDAPNNRVGIGTSSPSAPLTFAGSTGRKVGFYQGTEGYSIGVESSEFRFVTDAAGIFTFRNGGTYSSSTEYMRLDASGRLGIGTTSPAGDLQISGSGDRSVLVTGGTSGTVSVQLGDSAAAGQGGIYYDNSVDGLFLKSNGTERARIDSAGRWLLGTSSTPTVGDAQYGLLRTQGNTSSASGFGVFSIGRGQAPASITSGSELGHIYFTANDGSGYASISGYSDAAGGANDYPGRLVFSTTADGASSPTERMRITNIGDLTNKTSNIGSITGTGFTLGASGYFVVTRSADCPVFINRETNDGNLIEFRQDGATEGNINVSGTTVALAGAHLSRWSQLPSGVERTEILRGSLLSNIDEMCEWGDEENEQLNRMKVSDVEGDKNVSGVFQAWDDDDDTYINDFYCAMTGDFIIRIGAGVTVERGDLLMSAGDGTAKPQVDDLVRSCTVAKVTSTHVTCTYDDGSYCVPCVLMAC